MTKHIKQPIYVIEFHPNDYVTKRNRYISSVANTLKNIHLSSDLYEEFASTFYSDKTVFFRYLFREYTKKCP